MQATKHACEGIHSGFETEGWHYQGSKTGISVAPEKGLFSFKNIGSVLNLFFNEANFSWEFESGNLLFITERSGHRDNLKSPRQINKRCLESRPNLSDAVQLMMSVAMTLKAKTA